MDTLNTPAAPRKKPAEKKAPRLTHAQIAERLHNTACQSITAARFLLVAVGNQPPQDTAELRKQLNRVDAALKESCNELRALAMELRTGGKTMPPPA